MHLLPSIGNFREYVVVSKTAQIAIAQPKISTPAMAQAHVPHLTVEHCHCNGRVFYEQTERGFRERHATPPSIENPFAPVAFAPSQSPEK
jgi:hypothetical protein